MCVSVDTCMCVFEGDGEGADVTTCSCPSPVWLKSFLHGGSAASVGTAVSAYHLKHCQIPNCMLQSDISQSETNCRSASSLNLSLIHI